MTIPIIPGPFSFLDRLGQGAASIAQGKEYYRKTKREEEQQDRAEALKQVGTIFDAVQNNQLSTNALKSPFFLDMLKRSGIADAFSPENVAAKPEEQLRTAQSGYYQSVFGPQGDPNEQRQVLATGKPVTESEKLAERGAQLIGGIRNRRLEAPLTEPQESVISGVPGAATAAATDQTSQNPELGGIAKRSVRDLYTQLGRIPNLAEVRAYVDKDLRAKPFKNELTDPFLGNAIRDLQAELNEEETKRIAAETRRSANEANVVKDIKSQQEELRQRIAARDTDNKNLRAKLSPFASIPNADQSKLSQQDREALAKIAANDTANAKDQETLTGLNQQAAEVIAPRVAAARGEPEASLAQRRNLYDRRKAAILRARANAKAAGKPEDPRIRGKTVEQLIGARP